MKLIIDIPEEDYAVIKNGSRMVYSGMRSGKSYLIKMFNVILNGTPIPDNATNGDALISLYPNLKYTIQNGRVVTTIGVASSFDLDWWNALYQKGCKE